MIVSATMLLWGICRGSICYFQTPLNILQQARWPNTCNYVQHVVTTMLSYLALKMLHVFAQLLLEISQLEMLHASDWAFPAFALIHHLTNQSPWVNVSKKHVVPSIASEHEREKHVLLQTLHDLLKFRTSNHKVELVMNKFYSVAKTTVFKNCFDSLNHQKNTMKI